jgi:hypothetical protein
MTTHDAYVTNGAWPGNTARPDTVDEIADQFERPLANAEQYWTRSETGWPQPPRSWNAERDRARLGIAS